MKTITETFVAAVAARATANMHGSWGTEDSVSVIEQLVDAAYLGDKPEGFDAVRALVADLVNPSAFRQKLEKLAKDNPAHIMPSGHKRGTPSLALGFLTAAKVGA